MSPVPARAAQASRVLAFLLCAALLGCVQPPMEPPAGGFASRVLAAGSGQPLWLLERPPRAAPLRYRVVVIPGSGCAGIGPFAERYFAGLLHAHVLVLHKPGVHPQAATAPGGCPAEFVRADALSTWQEHARAALRLLARQGLDGAPVVLVGISEGAELLPALAPELPHLAGLVLLSASGLDPREAGRLQAQRLGALSAWQALARAQAGPGPDHAVAQGRSLRYWRDLWRWSVERPLIEGPWPLLQVWGDADALVPAEAYLRFGARAQGRIAPLCVRSLPGADHGLQSPGRDGVQQVWAWLEQWARRPGAGWCAPHDDQG